MTLEDLLNPLLCQWLAIPMTERKSSNVTIPHSLYLKVKDFIRGTSFRSVSEFVTYLVRREVENGKKD